MFSRKSYEHKGVEVRLEIWDTAGQEVYRGLTPYYYRGAQYALIVYAIDDISSFVAVDEWYSNLRSESPDTAVFLVANKTDQFDSRVVSPQSGTEKAAEIGAVYVETCAISGIGVDALFRQIVEAASVQAPRETESGGSTMRISNPLSRTNCC
jgi:small GTP-binding protein